MTDQFIGKWVSDHTFAENEGFNAYITALGVNPAVVAPFSKIKDTIEYSKDGDSWTVKLTLADKTKIIKITHGQEQELESPTGDKYKTCSHVVDGSLVEHRKPCVAGRKNSTIKRTVNGNSMTIVSTIDGTDPPVSMTQTMTKA